MQVDDQDPNLSTFCQVGGLSRQDQHIMAKVAVYIRPLLPLLTDRFYEVLAEEPSIRPYIEGRVEHLKKTHVVWLNSLFAGDYGPEFIQRQEKIGETHVRVRVPPLFVAASMAFLRGALPPVLAANIPNAQDAIAATASLLRLLDLCQYLIDRKYAEVLMDNLGISPALLVRLQTVGKGTTAKTL
ncbi:MAG TPA: protoglobin domain-containing protein [Acidocella sp.]|nr:protoglobin domain-containing protein [Acidocella sp.]